MHWTRSWRNEGTVSFATPTTCSGSFGPVLSLRSEVVLVKSEHAAERVFESLCYFVEKRLGLEVNREKSAVRPAKELSYLGFSFRGRRIVVSEDSLSDFKYRLKELSSRNWSVSMDYRMSKI
ncbi:hypothetical protein QEH52_19905 [Coraliomargarita sp. SDUM461003]|uniref:Reverse transcriptase domain-containing protein n=1 Tax=Thalassobacterium maritimum TaxID=3041265 RepID=A0ABU1B063_9BACT|nr:hypothetical protein [Coraliomargarita sp. SDUM461003]MDQ8209794.1 hypothetical protein [Coraliomargarita sp. SDUM461003]